MKELTCLIVIAFDFLVIRQNVVITHYIKRSPKMQYGFFDWQNRFEKFDTTKDPLWKLKSALNWELFRAELEAIYNREKAQLAQSPMMRC